MTNYEYYKDKIMETNHGISIVNGVPRFEGCAHTSCSDCLREAGNNCSDAKFIGWLMSEYEERTDWSKVPVDTPVLVKKSEVDTWRRRYFAGFRAGMVTTYPEGRTSWSVGSKNCGDALVSWPIAKLYKEEEQKLCSNGKPCTHPNCNRCGTTHFISECDYGKELNEQN